MTQVITVKEARKLLGTEAVGMSDDEIQQIITTLHSLARAAIDDAKLKLRRKKDARELANLIHDIYLDKKRAEVR